MVIGLNRRLWREEVLLAFLKGMLKFWKETMLKKEQSRVIVTLKGRFKGETGEKWHMMPLVDITYPGIKVRRWV